MSKKISIFLTVMAVMVFAAGCGTKEDRTTIHIKNGGKITENVTETFEADNYDEGELKEFVEAQIKDYIEESGNKGIKSSGFSVEEGKAYMTIDFDNAKTYADFNKETLFLGTAVQAAAEGYNFDGNFYPVKDGKVSKKATDKNVEDDSYQVVVTSENINVAVPGEVLFVSRADVELKDAKTVSIRKENGDDTSLTYIIYK